MKRPPAGKRAFYAMGQRHAAQGLPWAIGRQWRKTWPLWAQLAFYTGYLHVTRAA